MSNIKLIDIPNHLLNIDELYVFIGKDATGNEGIPAFHMRDMMMPMVCADQARVDALRGIAEQMAQETGIEIKLVRFTNREELETIAGAAVKQ